VWLFVSDARDKLSEHDTEYDAMQAFMQNKADTINFNLLQAYQSVFMQLTGFQLSPELARSKMVYARVCLDRLLDNVLVMDGMDNKSPFPPTANSKRGANASTRINSANLHVNDSNQRIAALQMVLDKVTLRDLSCVTFPSDGILTRLPTSTD
jgi:hypothetical protein